MGIKQYWIVDYLGLGGRKLIGYPKQQTFTVNTLENGEYKSTQFQDKQLEFDSTKKLYQFQYQMPKL
ncbi:Uma2 family endonuclease [Okeania sp. SIO2B3]|uniref:Uma2 family endonuclease n=1 Tax=Okeania sp. SIO2B3 TaxID=2607784 RepID=UPI0025EBD3D3|nr:Uma2 family endonuclease [Okeania sp. SIO2B3]